MDDLVKTPALAQLAMPEQDFGRAPAAVEAWARPSAAVLAARAVIVAAILAGAVLGGAAMSEAVAVGGVSLLEGLLIGLFALASAWLSFAAGIAVAGVLFDPRRTVPTAQGDGLTAIVMPIYNEDAGEVFANLAAMVDELPRAARDKFEVFVLSDTTDPLTWAAEERAFGVLRTLAAPTPVWYRRRRQNVNRKAGNVADFVRRWGGRYVHMILLDADSLMTGDCLATLRSAMIAEPGAGIVQSEPVLIGGATLFSRAGQFGSTVTGPVIARGVAAWQGEDGNYWGHNAIIRMDAFAAAAGLPDLSGRPPFGGTILSHDFVEAALIRRAGWTVRMMPGLEGSYEGAPGDLLSVLKRDRRWAQGNLQHARLVGAAGLSLPSRIHLAVGIVGYLMSPVWLTVIGGGIALSVVSSWVGPADPSHGFALLPGSPAFDTARMTALFGATVALVFVPSVIGFVRALADGRLRRGCGGAVGLAVGTVLDSVMAVLIAPIMVLAQTGIVLSIVTGRAVGWLPQVRSGVRVSWRKAIGFQAVPTLVGLMLAGVALLHSAALAAALSPALVSLIFAGPITKISSSERVGRWVRRRGLLRTPQEVSPPPVARAARRLAAAFGASSARPERARGRGGRAQAAAVVGLGERGGGSFEAGAPAAAEFSAASLDAVVGASDGAGERG